MRLFEIAQEFNALRDIVENDLEYDEESGEVIDTSETIKELFNNISLTLNDKLDNSAYIVRELTATSLALKEEADRLKNRASNYEKNADSLKKLMQLAFEASGKKKIQTSKFTFSTRKSETVEIDNNTTPDDLPRKFVRIKREFDKAKIKQALKDGEVISGVTMVEKQNFQIK